MNVRYVRFPINRCIEATFLKIGAQHLANRKKNHTHIHIHIHAHTVKIPPTTTEIHTTNTTCRIAYKIPYSKKKCA